MAPLTGFEPVTRSLGNCRSYPLSYRGIVLFLLRIIRSLCSILLLFSHQKQEPNKKQRQDEPFNSVTSRFHTFAMTTENSGGTNSGNESAHHKYSPLILISFFLSWHGHVLYLVSSVVNRMEPFPLVFKKPTM